MKLLACLSECGWIDGRVTPMTQDAPNTVAHCIPPVLAGHAKTLHPIYEDLSVRNEERTWQDDASAKPAVPRTEIEQSIQDVLSRSRLVSGGIEAGSRPVRIRWTELARRLGMPFAPTLSSWSFTRQFPNGSWPRCLIGPEGGTLASVERDALISVLRRNTNTDRCFFHFRFLATSEWTEDLLFEGSPNDAGRFPDERSNGGPESLIRELLDHHALECVAVQRGARVDWQADLEGSNHWIGEPPSLDAQDGPCGRLEHYPATASHVRI